MITIILIIIGIFILVLILSSCKNIKPEPKPPEPEPEPEPEPLDPWPWKWKLVDKTTERWKKYCDYMKKVTTDALLALELQKKVLVDGVWKKFYQWVSDWDLFHVLDYWDQPDEVWQRGTADCDGFGRLTCDVLGRFVKIPEVWWLEYYGFYRHYYYDKETDKWGYVVKAGGHAITVYKKDEKLLAFSNTSWWNTQDFQDFIEIGEQTFPEGLYWVIARNWCSGKMQWQEKAEDDEILKKTNIFHRRLYKAKNIKHLKKTEREVARKWLKKM